jgi:glycosyltransferase involved in cell wall biosynthesis
VLVVTSDWEGTPNVVLEAMASGLPVVATDVGGIRDLVRNGETGRLVARDDEADLAAAVVSLVADRSVRERYGKRARKFVEEHHALARLPANLGSLYDAVLGRAELRPTARLATEEAAG